MTGRGFFITGTDTGVGKTFVCAGIAAVLRGKGVDAGVMKPVETGCAEKNGNLAPRDALYLKNAAGADDDMDIINPYRFKAPLAPGIASRLEGKNIELKRIKDCYEILASRHNMMLVEGAGGILSPLSDTQTVADLIKILNLPVIVIAVSRLGAINHTLLTIRYAHSAGIEVRGIILNHASIHPDESASTNLEEIKRFSGLPVFGELPFCSGEVVQEMIKKYLPLSFLGL